MRLPEVERGDSLRHRMLITMISRVSGQRLPDAARVAFYDNDFVGPTLGVWMQRTMRGLSNWSVQERELMAASVATWNSCPFCIGAHSAVAATGLDKELVAAVLADYQTAPISEALKAALRFIEKATRTPDELTTDDAQTALYAGVSVQQLRDAAAVAALFGIVTRYANTLDFTIPTPAEFDKSAGILLRRGYG